MIKGQTPSWLLLFYTPNVCVNVCVIIYLNNLQPTWNLWKRAKLRCKIAFSKCFESGTRPMNGDMSNIALWFPVCMLSNFSKASQPVYREIWRVGLDKKSAWHRKDSYSYSNCYKKNYFKYGRFTVCVPPQREEKLGGCRRVWIQFHVHTEYHFPGYREDLFSRVVCLKEENGFSPRHKVFLSRQAWN